MTDTCYLCGQLATSDEHVPPSGFFPDGYRKQLIKLRSCAKHNENTSKDDEYVRNIVAMILNNNEVGVHHSLGPVFRSLERSVGLQRVTFRNPRRVSTPHGDSYGFEFDRSRFDRIMRKIAYGLYFKKRGKPWRRALHVMPKQVTYADGSSDPATPMVSGFEIFASTEPHEGANPEVFKFFVSDRTEDKTFVRMEFYENLIVYVIPAEGTAEATLDAPLGGGIGGYA